MPSISKSQQALFAIAEHSPEKLHKENKGLAKLSHKTLHEFASGSEAGKPEHVGPSVLMLKGESRGVVHENTKSLMNSGKTEHEATKAALQASHPHKNLGAWLHPKKG